MGEFAINEALAHSKSFVQYQQQLISLTQSKLTEYHENKDELLDKQIVEIVNEMREELEESIAKEEKSLYYIMLCGFLNLLSEPDDNAIRFATLAVENLETPSIPDLSEEESEPQQKTLANTHETLLVASETFLQFQEFRRAEILAESAQEYQNTYHSYMQLSRIYRLQNSESSSDLAIFNAKKAVSLTKNASTWAEYGMALLRSHNETELSRAENALKQSLKLQENPFVCYNLALLAKVRLDFELSYDSFMLCEKINPYSEEFSQGAQALDKLAAAVQGRIGGHALELSALEGQNCICTGLNNEQLEVKCVSCLENGLPWLYIVAYKEEKCALALSFNYDLLGKSVKFSNFMCKEVQLRTEEHTCTFVCIEPKDEEEGLWIDGKRVADLQLE